MKKLLLLLFSAMLSFNAHTDWSYQAHVDEFEETTRHIIMSERVSPTQPLPWPSSSTFAYMYFDCDVGNFTLRVTANNLLDDTTEDGYNLHDFRMKLDSEITTIEATQEWGSEYFSLDDKSTSQIFTANRVLIQLNHYADGTRVWPFDMTGLHREAAENSNHCPISAIKFPSIAKGELAKQLIEEERKKNERLETERATEKDAFEKDQEARSLKSTYVGLIAARVRDEWRYMGAKDDWGCDIYIIQDEDGYVEAVNVQDCTVDDSYQVTSFRNSIERAVYKASPLPMAPDQSVFDTEIMFHFRVN